MRFLRHPLVTAAALTRSAAQIARVIRINFARIADIAMIQIIILAILVGVRVIII